LERAVEDEERLVDVVVHVLGRPRMVGIGSELELVEGSRGRGCGRLPDEALARAELQDVASAVAEELRVNGWMVGHGLSID
jgi:hypothetical protein